MNSRKETANPSCLSADMHSSIGSITRPTEAQLKWALLHHRRVALAVQGYVRRLYLYPESLQDVPGELSELELVDDLDEQLEIANRPIIRLSQGRRALLRISQHAYEHRKRHIVDHGFKYHRSCSDCESDESSCRSCESDPSQVPQTSAAHNDESTLQVPSQVHNPVPSTIRRKRFRQRRRKFQPRCSDPERVRRFKDAFQAALHSLELAPNHDRFQLSPTPFSAQEDVSQNAKRRTWTRPDSDVATRLPKDAYSIWGCSQIPKRQPAVHNPSLTPGKAPLDRSATWLQLLHVGSGVKTDSSHRRDSLRTPDAVSSSHIRSSTGCQRSADGTISILTPALRQHVADVAREIFSGGRESNNDKRTSPCLESLERDVSSFVEQFEQHFASAIVETEIPSSLQHSYSFSPRHSDFRMYSSSPLFSSPKVDGGIAPVVTYDSDDVDGNTTLDESAITRNPHETFTIQVLDSSFSCWNASVTEITQGDEGAVSSGNVPDFNTKHGDDNAFIGVQRELSVPSSFPMDEFHTTEVLEMSPVNFKRILQLLPDQQVLAISPLKAAMDEITCDLPVSRSEDIALWEAPRVSESCQLSIPEPTNGSSVKNPVSSMTCKSNTRTLNPYLRRTNHCTMDNQSCRHSDSGWNSAMTPIPSTSSAGCGLHSQRPSHYNVRWEKQWML